MQPTDRFDLFRGHEPRIGVIYGTGPSLTPEIIEQTSHLRRFGANLTYRLGVDVVLGCNSQFWDHYYDDSLQYDCQRWTTRPIAKQGVWPEVSYIEERWEDGLSTDLAYICAHHGSGPQVVNLAMHYGCKVMLLVGWDMRYPGKVSDREYTGNRHYFGEYPKELQHWPRTGPNGELSGLIREMETINPSDYSIEIYNCTPGSAMKCFPFRSLSGYLSDSGLSKV